MLTFASVVFTMASFLARFLPRLKEHFPGLPSAVWKFAEGETEKVKDWSLSLTVGITTGLGDPFIHYISDWFGFSIFSFRKIGMQIHLFFRRIYPPWF